MTNGLRHRGRLGSPGARSSGLASGELNELRGHASALAQREQMLEGDGCRLQLTQQCEPDGLVMAGKARRVDAVEVPLRQLPVAAELGDPGGQQRARLQGAR